MTQSLRQVYGAGKALGSFALSITVFLQVSMATPPMQLQASEVAGGMQQKTRGVALRWCLWVIWRLTCHCLAVAWVPIHAIVPANVTWHGVKRPFTLFNFQRHMPYELSHRLGFDIMRFPNIPLHKVHEPSHDWLLFMSISPASNKKSVVCRMRYLFAFTTAILTCHLNA
jgi:hypothetical protein